MKNNYSSFQWGLIFLICCLVIIILYNQYTFNYDILYYGVTDQMRYYIEMVHRTLLPTFLLKRFSYLSLAKRDIASSMSPLVFKDISGVQTLHLEKVHSTHLYAQNELSKDLIDAHFRKYGYDKWMAIYADMQTAGIGSRSPSSESHDTSTKQWVSFPGNIHSTFILAWPKSRLADLVFIPQITALAITHVFTQTYHVPESSIRIKWVNDVLLQDKKVAGILVQSTGQIVDDLYTIVLISVGINVEKSPDTKTMELLKAYCPATHLHAVYTPQGVHTPHGVSTGQHEFPKAMEVWGKVATQLQLHILKFVNMGFEVFKPQVEKYLAWIDRDVTLEIDNSTMITGKLIGISLSGAIRIKTSDGKISEYTVGTLRLK